MQTAGIIGWGYYLPSQVITNRYMEQVVDTSDEWIRSRTGISERRRALPGQATSDLATLAAEAALKKANLTAQDIDLIIVATVTPDMAFPATACLVQANIGATKAAAFDLSAACSGFIYGLSLAKSLIATGEHRYCLVIGAETLSRVVDYSDRNTCVLFGDGAGAVVLGPSQQGVVRRVELGADGAGANFLSLPGGGSRMPATARTVELKQHYVQMDGQEVFKFAVSKMPEASLALLGNLGLTADDIDWLIPHQANQRIIDSALKRLKLPASKAVVNLGRYGNMSAASIPVALAEAADAGRFQPGERLVLVGFGGGLTWGAALIEW